MAYLVASKILTNIGRWPSLKACHIIWRLQKLPSSNGIPHHDQGNHMHTGPQLPNCQTQCHFSWLVVSPLRQKSTRSGNLVLAGILAFYAVKTASLSPLGPQFQLCARALHHRRLLGERGRPQPTRCLYLQVIRPSQVFSDMIYAQ